MTIAAVSPGGRSAPESARERELLAPYLPRLMVDWLDQTPSLRHRAVDGTVAFVDISGFTKLSEKLAGHGKIGAEELSGTIGTCFVNLLDIAYENGGGLIKFGGDALLLLFTGDDHQRRACQAAFAMRHDLRITGRLTVLGHRVTLRMSVGVHSGSFDMFLVGSSHRELLVTGPAATATVTMEAAANAGEILISRQTAQALGASELGPEKEGGFLLRRSPIVATAAASRDAVTTDADLAVGVPAAILEAVRSEHHEAEHRRVSVAFVHFDGTDAMLAADGPEAVAAYLDRLVTDVQVVVEREGITFLGSDIDRDGGKLILVAGAPSTTGDDELHILLALRDVMDEARAPRLRIGVNRGPVFAGEIGPRYRRTFTVMGDTVNLAARLMAKATPGQILAAPEVLARSRHDFDLVEVPPFHVKGKAALVHAFDVGAHSRARQASAPDATPLVGRLREMEMWEALVERARAGSGAVIEVVGEPGLGKSRLVEEFRSVAGDMPWYSANCEYYESSTPYGALRGLVRAILGLEPNADPTTAAKHLSGMLEKIDPLLAPWAPLVGSVIDVDLPATKESAELEAEFRGHRLGEVMTDIFDHRCPGPTVIVVEDTHWSDESSAELLRHLLADLATRPWLVVLTRRDVETGFRFDGPQVTKVRLEPLEAEAAAQLVLAGADAAPLPRHEIELLAERSGGNPLFLRELVAAARKGESIESLPDSVEAVIGQRIDGLAARDRHFLRRVSVLGRSAPVALLSAVVTEVPSDDDPIWSRLEDFVTVDGDGNLVFRHALLRDGAYDGLAYRLRRELHGRVAEAMRARAEDPDDLAATLSIHYFHAERFQPAWTYSLMAAADAEAMYANVEAAELFERALSTARHLPELSVVELRNVHESLGDARDHAGDYPRAVTQYKAARRLARDDPASQARLMLKLSRAQGWQNRYSDALRWITRALTILGDADDLVASRQRALLFAWYARFSQEQGRHARAISWCDRAIAEALRADEKEALANAYAVLDWALMDLGTLDSPENWKRGLAIFEELGDLRGQATLLNSLGMFEYFRGRWTEALGFYTRAQDMARRVGNTVQLAFYENNVAEIALDQGRVDEAASLFESVSHTWRAAGYRSGAAYVQCNLARVATRRGEYARAAELFDKSRREAEAVGSQADSLEAGSRQAESQLAGGDLSGALERAEFELERARAMDGVAPQVPLLQRVRGVALARMGDMTGATDALRESVETARARQVEYEEALTLRVMASLGIAVADRAPADLERESARMLESLGVIDTLELLPAKG